MGAFILHIKKNNKKGEIRMEKNNLMISLIFLLIFYLIYIIAHFFYKVGIIDNKSKVNIAMLNHYKLGILFLNAVIILFNLIIGLIIKDKMLYLKLFVTTLMANSIITIFYSLMFVPLLYGGHDFILKKFTSLKGSYFLLIIYSLLMYLVLTIFILHKGRQIQNVKYKNNSTWRFTSWQSTR